MCGVLRLCHCRVSKQGSAAFWQARTGRQDLLDRIAKEVAVAVLAAQVVDQLPTPTILRHRLQRCSANTGWMVHSITDRLWLQPNDCAQALLDTLETDTRLMWTKRQ